MASKPDAPAATHSAARTPPTRCCNPRPPRRRFRNSAAPATSRAPALDPADKLANERLISPTTQQRCKYPRPTRSPVGTTACSAANAGQHLLAALALFAREVEGGGHIPRLRRCGVAQHVRDARVDDLNGEVVEDHCGLLAAVIGDLNDLDHQST